MARISNDIIEQCRKMYEEDHIPCAQIAKHFGIGSATIRRRLKELGVKIIQYPHAGKFEVSKVIELYNQGIQIWKIAEMFKSSEETISKVLKKNNIKVAVKPSFDNTVFDVIDTEEKAYWLGFIWADGCIIKHNEEKYTYAFELGISIQDYPHLKKFCDFIKLDTSKIKIRKEVTNYINGKEVKSKASCRVQISNKHFWNQLNNLGCCPDKTHNEIFPDLKIFSSTDLIRHFIRGCVDGDGWVYLDNRNHVICGLCGQEQFLTRVLEVLPEEFRNISLYNSNSEVIKIIKYSHLKAQRLITWLYSNSSIHLDRKFNIAATYIREGISKLGNICKTPEMDNTEITTETKESVVS